MRNTGSDDPTVGKQRVPDGIVDFRHQKTLLKTGALQDAIFSSAYFSSIATDEKGVIQIFNVGAERMLGYTPPLKWSTRLRRPTSSRFPVTNCSRAPPR